MEQYRKEDSNVGKFRAVNLMKIMILIKNFNQIGIKCGKMAIQCGTPESLVQL
jgi:hypothetical protein